MEDKKNTSQLSEDERIREQGRMLSEIYLKRMKKQSYFLGLIWHETDVQQKILLFNQFYNPNYIARPIQY